MPILRFLRQRRNHDCLAAFNLQPSHGNSYQRFKAGCPSALEYTRLRTWPIGSLQSHFFRALAGTSPHTPILPSTPFRLEDSIEYTRYGPVCPGSQRSISVDSAAPGIPQCDRAVGVG